MAAIFALIKVEGAGVGGETGVFDEIFGRFDGGKAVILQHVFFDDNAVDVVGTAMEPKFT